MALIHKNLGGRVLFYPFCSNDFLEIAGECVGCQFAQRAGLAVMENGSLIFPFSKKLCNPHIEEYPLPLHKCSVCNKSLLDAVLSYIIIISLMTVIANLWSFLVWIRTKKRPQIIFKLSLAVSDFLFGAILLPSVAIQLIDTMYTPHEEYFDFSTYLDREGSIDNYEMNWTALFAPFHNHFIAVVLYISQGASLCSVLLLKIDRHIAITYNIKYHQIMTKRKSVYILIIMWLAVSVLGFASTFACGTYLTKPFALFLPIVEPESNKKELLKVLVIYLMPLSIVFLASSIIAIWTSIKLYRLSKSCDVTYYGSRSSNVSAGKIASWQLQKLSLYLMSSKTHKANKSTNDQNNIETEDSTQMVSDSNACSAIDENRVNAKVNSMASENKERKDAALSFPRKSKSGPQRSSEKSGKQSKKKKSQVSSKLIPGRRNEYVSATRTLMLILASYALCVLPLACLLVTYLVNENTRHNEEYVEEPFNKAILDGFAISVGIFMLSSLRNCIIHSIRNREYRTGSKKLWRSIATTICCKKG